jgi:hypothetical protein
LLAIDEQNNIGWFASDRHQPAGKVVIYIFIPNETKKIIENELPQRLALLAAIHAISETWVKDADYTQTLRKIQGMVADTLRKPEGAVTFRMVISDAKVYHSLDDFRNEEAKASYREMLKAGEQLQSQQNQLDRLRREYAASGKEERSRLSASILELENQVENAMGKQKDLENKVRRLEKGN